MSNSGENDLTGQLKLGVNRLVNTGQFDAAKSVCQVFCDRHPDSFDAWFILGAVNGRLGDWNEAENSCRQAIRLNPQHPVAHYNLAIALLKQGRTADGSAELEQAISMQPDYLDAIVELGRTCMQNGDATGAIRQFNRAIQLNPHAAQLHLMLAHACREAGQPDSAVTHYNRSIELDSSNAQAYYELAGILMGQSKLDEAISLLESALSGMPDRPGLLYQLAVAYEEQGDADIALTHYKRLMALDPGNTGVQCRIANILALRGDPDAAAGILERLLAERPGLLDPVITYASLAHILGDREKAYRLAQEKLADPATPDSARSTLYFAVANLSVQGNDPDRTFGYYTKANSLRHAVFDYESHSGLVNALVNNFSVDRHPSFPRAEDSTDTPIFIVGMPRSGTSLTEQILASHPDVYGAGELHSINYIARKLSQVLNPGAPYMMSLDKLDTGLLNDLAGDYISEITRRSGNTRFVTNKMPQNFLHLGLIDLLFPGARVIHCLRDPMDTCLSCYFQNFSGNHPYAYSLKNIGRYYRLYRKLMEHWKKILRIPIHEIRYESLVKNQEQETRKLLGFCRLDWNSACMDFHSTRRTVSTASYSQVRKPVYSDSIGRWRLYERHLGPLISELQHAG